MVVWVFEEFDWVAKKIGNMLFHSSYLHPTLLGSPAGEYTSRAGASPKLANLNANFRKAKLLKCYVSIPSIVKYHLKTGMVT